MLGFVVMVARFSGPICVNLSVESPVRDVEAVNRVSEGARLQRIRRKPATSVPCADLIPNLRFRELEFQHTLRADWPNLGLDGNQRCGAAKIAPLRDASWIEGRDGLTTLAAHGCLLRAPAVLFFRDISERRDKAVFIDCLPLCIKLHRRDCPAVRTDECLFTR